MELTEKFDIAKKAVETNGSKLDGYNGHAAYMTKKDWNTFLEEMSKDEQEVFVREIKETEHPPKMASYGSSSRFLYNIVKKNKIDGFVFEKKLATGLGSGIANLDGYIADKNIYIEAKCHEFYGDITMPYKEAHKKLYDYISSELGEFKYSVEVKFSWNKKDVGSFDLKQMICHLSAIAKSEPSKPVKFIYLIYNPKEEIKYLKNIGNEDAAKAIKSAYNKEISTANSIDFVKIYKTIWKYHHNESNEKEAPDFEFMCFDQKEFKEYIEKLQQK